MGNSLTLASKNASNSAYVYKKSKEASATVPTVDQPPTAGKNIPIVVGAVKLTGDVIWIHTFLTKTNECRCHVAVCFGRNTFGRPISLSSLSSGGNYIYRRSGGKVIDPPSAVRFYDGTQTTADPKIRSVEGDSKTPAFTGYIYAVLENVVLGDFSAEFTDNGADAPLTTVTTGCDSALSGVDLKYNAYTGLYYGLKNPGTTNARLITSDGCRVLRKVRVRFAIGDFGAPNYYPTYPVPYDLNIIRCSGYVSITGYSVVASPGGFGEEPPWEWSVDPDSGVVQSGAPWQTAPSGSAWNGIDLPGSTGLEIKAAFAVNGPGKFAVLRFFDRSDIYYDTTGRFMQRGADSNVAGAVFDLREQWYSEARGQGRMYFGYRYAYADYIIERDCVDENVSSPRQFFLGPSFYDQWHTAAGWWTWNAPNLDDFIWLENKLDHSDLGGYKIESHALHVYRLKYSSNRGVEIGADATLTTTEGFGVDSSRWTITGINYDPKGDRFLISADPPASSILSPRIYTIDALGFTSYIVTGLPGYKLMPVNNGISADGYAVLQNGTGSSLKKIDLSSGESTTVYSGTAPTRPPVVDLSRHLVSVPTVSGITKTVIDQVNTQDISLTEILTDCCVYRGYSTSDLVFQGLTGLTVKGLMISATVRMTDIFNRLGTLFSFTFVETDGKLKFLKKRSGGSTTVDVSLSNDDLVMSGGSDDGYLRSIQRESANNLLGGMDLEYMDPAKYYESTTIKIRRPVASFDSGASTRVETLSVPVTLDSANAYSLMYEAFYTILRKQSRVAFSVPSWKARIEPGDCISVDVDGIVTTGVAVRVSTTEAFSQDIEMEIFDASGETQLGDTEEPPVADVIAAVGWYIPLEIPFIRAADYAGPTKSLLYHGISTKSFGDWAWADLYRGSDGINFTKILEYRFSPMTVATVENTVGYPAMPFAADDVNEITITVISGSADDFMSVSYVEQMNGANRCALGVPGKWEIISYRNLVENSDGTLTLSGLQRGLYGTHVLLADPLTTFHQPGEYLIYLDPIKLQGTEYNATEYGRQDLFALNTPDVAISETIVGPVEFKDVAMLQFQPANVTATHVPGSSDLVVTWDEVTAIPCEWTDAGTATPMHAPTQYRVKSGSRFDVVVTGNTYTWTGYGGWYGPDEIADELLYVTVTPIVAGLGNGIPVVDVPSTEKRPR